MAAQAPTMTAPPEIGDERDLSLRALHLLPAWWRRAVFLRLYPPSQSQDVRGYRLSGESLLDEAGARLPALLEELDDAHREALITALADILPDYEGLSVSKPGLDERLHYSLVQRIRGVRAGRTKAVTIPAWMLSEGTRRVTAILALLHHPEPPTLLCIEEVENGLDPWTVQSLLRHLQAAAERGIQVLLTTHSPWLLDHVPMESIVQVRKVDGDAIFERFMDRPAIKAYDPSVPAGTRYVNEVE
jgi:predicted ATPase